MPGIIIDVIYLDMRRSICILTLTANVEDVTLVELYHQAVFSRSLRHRFNLLYNLISVKVCVLGPFDAIIQSQSKHG